MKKIKVHDPMQEGYTYSLSEPEGKKFHPEFKPELTPKQMLELGVFDGNYFDGFTSEFPSSWFKNAKVTEDGLIDDPDLNFFRIHASKPLSYWQEKGWIYEEDPRGWFQWYCRYYMGRRCSDDMRQIKRWKAIRRHIAQVEKNCRKRDLTCRRRQRQAILHWAYDSRKI